MAAAARAQNTRFRSSGSSSGLPQVGGLTSALIREGLSGARLRRKPYRQRSNIAGPTIITNDAGSWRWSCDPARSKGDRRRGGRPAVVHPKTATTTYPSFSPSAADPVQGGACGEFESAEGNITGVSSLTDAIAAKRLGLLRELMTKSAGTVADLSIRRDPDAGRQSRESAGAAHRSVWAANQIFRASTESEIAAAFAGIAESRGRVRSWSPQTPFSMNRRSDVAHSAAATDIPRFTN